VSAKGPTHQTMADSCGTGAGDVCWSRADPITLLRRAFRDPVADEDKRLGAAAAAAAPAGAAAAAVSEAAVAAARALRAAGYTAKLRFQCDAAGQSYEEHMVEDAIARVAVFGGFTTAPRVGPPRDVHPAAPGAAPALDELRAGTRCSLVMGPTGCGYVVGVRPSAR
jgi:hypothetical protein